MHRASGIVGVGHHTYLQGEREEVERVTCVRACVCVCATAVLKMVTDACI